MGRSSQKSGKSAGWGVDTLRFTSFSADELSSRTVEQWWRDVTGMEDRQVVHQPSAPWVEWGTLDGQVLTLRWHDDRIDWVLQPEKNDENRDTIVSLGLLKPSLDRFFQFTDKWFTLGPPKSNRIVLGAILLNPVETRQEGYLSLEQYLKNSVKLDAEGSSDFTYQINRRRKSAVVPELDINRLTKWFVWTWKSVSIQMQILPKQEIGQDIGEEKMACRLDLDINTAQETEGNFNIDIQKKLLIELRSLLEEIAEKGDVK